ncbi:MAG TPA: alpha/beta hydrolase [Trebonia sp.]|jgi:pimeloyl-ACP methyl ester carboxylesterase|nr:alpha/beta hydrolase [Trebonia sp.]
MSVDTERRLISLPGGRDIDVLTIGPEDGLPLVIHEGTPGGLTIYRLTAEAALSRGLRVVKTARPGYEGSTPRPGRTVGDVAADIADVLDELGARTFITYGVSGGGPHALACAANLPGRCLAAASVAGVAPYGVEGLDFLAGMGPENVEEFGKALEGSAALTPYLEHEAAAFENVTPDDVIAAFGGLVSDVDKSVLTGEYAANLSASLRAALSNGIVGWHDDDLAFATDWGFDVAKLAAPAAVWQGDQDRMVPFAHGQWLAAHIPGARVHLMPGEGHLSLTLAAIGDILDDLLDLAGIPARTE